MVKIICSAARPTGRRGMRTWRDINYFFYYYCVPEIEETAEIQSLRGEAYFLRAYWHFYLLIRFGDIPIMDVFGMGMPQLPVYKFRLLSVRMWHGSF